MSISPADGRPVWKWSVCGLLLLATTINYMDRLCLNLASKRIMTDLRIDVTKYADLEAYFGPAFAIGGLCCGFLADLINVRWMYPLFVLAWSTVGFLTGYAETYEELLACRVLLGFFEAANWPCALRTTQRLLAPHQRSLGNGILQSGAALGAILTPMLILWCLDKGYGWREPFLVVGASGAVWAVAWLLVVRSSDLTLTTLQTGTNAADSAFWPALKSILTDRRFFVLATVVVGINLTWHYFRAWMPLFLQDGRGYSEDFMLRFSVWYYLAADVGSLSAGFLALRLARTGLPVATARRRVFLVCALLALLSIPASLLGPGPLLLALLLILGFASLAMFPLYYSFSQEISMRHQGKVTGMLTCTCWIAMAIMQKSAGESIKATKSYDLGVALAGLPPLIAFAALALYWSAKPAAPPEASKTAA